MVAPETANCAMMIQSLWGLRTRPLVLTWAFMRPLVFAEEAEPFGVSVRARTARRDLRCRDAGAGQGRLEVVGELPGAVADQEPEVRGPVAEIHEQVADLLGGPRAVRVGDDPQDVHVTGAHRDRRPARPARVGPLLSDQVAPLEHGAGRD